MTLRWQIALALAAVASLATIVIGVASYRSTSDRLLAEVDRSLLDLDAIAANRSVVGDPERGPLSGYSAQIVLSNGSVGPSTFATPPAPNAGALAVVNDPRQDSFDTVSTDDGSYRIRTIGLQRGAIQIGRPLDETERVLASLRVRTALLVALVATSSAAVGLWIAGRVTASLRRLTVAAEHVGSTGRLDVHVDDDRNDEVGRLATAFDRMLSALARSQDEQHRLVQDAGHELRTPLTSVRTNLDTLRRYPHLSPIDRSDIIDDLHAETEELTGLVNEIIAVASGDAEHEAESAFDLGDLAVELAARAERRFDRRIVVSAVSSPVVAQRGAVERAVSNLLDNAHKFDRSGSLIDVTVTAGCIEVADRGPGISEPDLPNVFDRFGRAEQARSLPGSGLGLSIVRDVARRHGGVAFARNRDGGGAIVGFRLGPVSLAT